MCCYDEILSNFTECIGQVIKPHDFISSVIISLDEEGDPWNLLVSFKLYSQLLTTFSDEVIQPFLEPIFTQFSNYFPIEFTPPQNDTNKITSEDLIDWLNWCFISSPLISDACFTFLLHDKLASTSKTTKD